MPLVIDSYSEYKGTHTPSALDTEEDVKKLLPTTPALVQGFLDTLNMTVNHLIVIREYISWDTPHTWRKMTERSINGVQIESLWLNKLLWIPKGYELTLEQKSGSLIGYPYYVVEEIVVVS